MTYQYVNEGLWDPVEILQKFNILNPIWTKINLVRMGYQQEGQSGLDITRTFYMINDT